MNFPGAAIVFVPSRVCNDMGMSAEQEVVHLREQVAQLLSLVQQLRGTIEKQQAHIAKLVKMTFGHRGERIEGPTLFDGLADEPPPSDIAVAPEDPTPKRKGHGRKKNPADLPRKREEIDLSEAEKVCPCCSTTRQKIGEAVNERLDYTPSSIFVRVIARPTYVCRTCERTGDDPQIAKAELPPEPVPKSGVGAGLLAQLILSKYVDHLPLYRQEAIFARLGWPVSRSRLCDLLADSAALLDPIHGSGARHLGCWAHARRKFVEARESDPEKATKALAFIRTLYAVEREIAEGELADDTAVSLRRTRAGPILEQFGAWLEGEHRTALPKSPFGQAVSYARNQWPSLVRYLGDARFSIDNNAAERAVRPLAVGRKNWLFLGGDGGLATASMLMSLCASVKRHGLNPWDYLADALTQLAENPADVNHLLPDAWAQRPSAVAS